MYPQSLFRMVSEFRLLQVYLQNVPISRRQLHMLSSTQLPSHTASTCSTSHAPNSRLNRQEMIMRRFSSYLKPPAEFSPKKFSPKKSNRDSSGASHNFSEEHIFSPKRRYDENRTISVGGLTKFTTEKLLYEYFLRFGTITGCRLVQDKLTGSSKEYGFVEFESVEQLNSAIEFNPHIIDDVRVKLDYATSEFDLIVANLTSNITEKSLSDYFSRYGELRTCEIKEGIKPGVSTGFVGFWSEEEVLQALADRPHIINGKMVASFKNNQQFSVRVDNLGSFATDDMLFQTFSKYGKLVHWEVKRSRDQNRNRSVGCGYVLFETAEQAIQAVNGGPHLLLGRTLKVFHSKLYYSAKGHTLSKKSIK